MGLREILINVLPPRFHQLLNQTQMHFNLRSVAFHLVQTLKENKVKVRYVILYTFEHFKLYWHSILHIWVFSLYN